MSATVHDDEDAAPATPAGTNRRRATGFVVAAVLAGVFFVSTVLLAVVAADLKADKDELVGGREEVAEAAGRFVDALLSYDYRDTEGFRERVLALTAPPFTEQFEVAVAALEEGFVAAEQVSVPTIDEVYVTEVDEGTATAIVEYGRVLQGSAGDRREANLYVRLGLVERGGAWRVNDVTNLNLALANQAGGTASDGSTTTTGG